MKNDYLNFFSHEQVSDSLILFTEGYSMVHRFSIGVVIGADSILVIDAGLGMSGDFREQIEKVVGTEKPIACVCTHNNIDHIASAKQFDRAYMCDVDIPDVSRGLDYERRQSDLAAFSVNNHEVIEYGRRHAIHNEDSVFLPIQPGHVFDLGGGVKIEVIAVPGHTPGSIAFFNRKEKYCLTGDAINADTHISRLSREEYKDFAETVRRFAGIVGDDVTFYSGHLPLPQKIGVVKDLAGAADDLYRGDFVGDVPMIGIFGPQTEPRQATRRFRIHGNTLLVYNVELVDPEGSYDINTVSLFGHEQVSPRVFIVTENISVVHRLTVGVIVGDEKVLVIDAGVGLCGNLRSYIEQLVGSEKPIICVLTDGQLDHLGSASLFDEVYLNSADLPLVPYDNEINGRLAIVYSLSNHNATLTDYCRDKGEHTPIMQSGYLDIQDGDRIDLGGILVEAVAMPGHTPGAMGYLVPDEKLFFTGDAVNADTFLTGLDEKGLVDYADRLDALADRIGDDSYTLYARHLNRGQRFATMDNLAAACREVAAGDTYGDPPGQSVYIFEKEKRSRRLHYHGNTCVIYDRESFKTRED